MDDQAPPNPALLPAGLRDLLPPAAAVQAAGVQAAMAVFAAHAYARVKPPLLEFEDSFLGGSGAAVADQSFRIMDPESHRMMVLRADMTPQVARIAATRLATQPRPLRLSYAGECVRVRGAAGTDRQVPQAGIELIGADNAAADAEVMLVAVQALAAMGLARPQPRSHACPRWCRRCWTMRASPAPRARISPARWTVRMPPAWPNSAAR